MEKIKTLLFLDDYRDPFDKKMDWLRFSPIGRNVDVVWVRSFQEFTDHIMINGLPDGICFDHDLGLHNGDGYQCAKYICEYCMNNNLEFPPYNVQSANPVGKENIISYIENFKKFL